MSEELTLDLISDLFDDIIVNDDTTSHFIVRCCCDC